MTDTPEPKHTLAEHVARVRQMARPTPAEVPTV